MKKFLTNVIALNVITCVDVAQCGLRGTAVELMGLVSSWTTLVAIAISSTSIPNLRDAGAIRRVRPSTGDNMKKFRKGHVRLAPESRHVSAIAHVCFVPIADMSLDQSRRHSFFRGLNLVSNSQAKPSEKHLLSGDVARFRIIPRRGIVSTPQCADTCDFEGRYYDASI